jgi:DNA-binding protein HU-beta
VILSPGIANIGGIHASHEVSKTGGSKTADINHNHLETSGGVACRRPRGPEEASRGDAMLTDMVGLVAKHLKKGSRIRIGGLGILQVRKRAARMGRNPATGEAIKIKASKKVAFRPSKELKEAV